jgi:hypothetical protein
VVPGFGIRRRRPGRRWLGALACALIAAVAATPVHASPGWVDQDFFGINFQQLRELGPKTRKVHLDRIADLGIRDMRVGFAWPRIEPLPPINGHHRYKWTAFDSEIAALARHGIRPQANITQTPSWNADTSIIGALNCGHASSFAPKSIAPYAPLVKAVARRYGRGGTFWRAHPELTPLPVVRYEIWNEPNLRGGWCPNPQPERYADMFVAAARAIRSVDPHAQVVIGGTAPPGRQNRHYLGIAEFLSRATARRPGLARVASGAAVHIYPPTGAREQLDRLAWFRSQLRHGGIPNRVPMLINEIGWPAGGGRNAISEAARAKAYTRATRNIPRTNCNVMGMLPQAWTSRQQDPQRAEDWYGIASPATAMPYPSAWAYSKSLRLMRGDLRQPPPDKPLMACPGMPRPTPPGSG